MNAGRFVALAVIITVIALTACKNDVSGPGGDTTNLIKNPSFENGDHWSFRYWDLSDTLFDTSQQFSEDIPAVGGTWSLKLVPDITPTEGFARYYITGDSPKASYRLTVWAKALNNWQQGYIALGLLSLGQWTVRRQTSVSSGNWEIYTLEDTVRLYSQDTLVVYLSAGSTQVISTGAVLFDQVRLERR